MTLPSDKIERLSGVDAVKFFAAIAVILIHLHPSSTLATQLADLLNYCAVPFFFCISLTFLWIKFLSGKSVSLRSIRWDRILVPYAIWSIGYYALRVVKSSLYGKLEFPNPVGCLFYGDSSAQLYFIPLLVIYQLLAVYFMNTQKNYKSIMMTAIVVLLSYFFIEYGNQQGYWAFRGAFERGLFYVGVSFILAKIHRANIKAIKVLLSCGVFLAMILAAVVFLHFEFGTTRGPLLGFLLSGIAINWRLSLNSARIRWIMSGSYGIYLSHFLFIAFFEQLNAKLSLGFIPYTVMGKLMIGSLVGMLCLALIKVLRANPTLSYLFLGEGGKRASVSQS
jgi:peptidoglycan/LPS O-acetylase OafA/YrhL